MKLRTILIGCGVAIFVLVFSLVRRPGSPNPVEAVVPSIAAEEAGVVPASGVPEAPKANVQRPVASAEVAASSAPSEFREWLTDWSRGARDAGEVKRGRELAMARKEQMLAWFETDPAKALKESISWSEWRALPEELRDAVEEPFSARVDFAVLPNCPPGDSTGPKIHPHRVKLDGEWRDAYVFGQKAVTTTKDAMPARGILLEGKIVLAEGAVERLSAEDEAAVRDLFATRGEPGISAVSGGRLGIDQRTILLGGELLRVGSAEEETSLRDLFAEAERSLHPKSVAMAMSAARAGAGTIAFDLEGAKEGILHASSTWTETPKNTLAVRINYSDTPSYSYSLTEMTNLMRNASNAVKVMSYGKTRLMPRIASVTLPKTWQAYQTGGPDLIVNDTRTALSARGINRDAYHIVVHAHPGMNFSYAGLGVIGGANNWLNGNVSLEVTVHELGHNYGLGHAHFWAGVTGMGSLGRTQADGSLVEREEYGDPFDIMGGSSLPAGQFNAYGKAALNWIEQKEVISVFTNGIYRVYRYDHADARTNAGTKLALKVAAPSGETYWVSHRRLFTSNASLYRGANIVRADGPGDQSLIDTSPFSRPSTAFSNDRSDAGLGIGRTFSDSLGTVQITTIASGGTSPQEYIDVQVTFLDGGAYTFFTGQDLATNGLVGSYVNRSLRLRPTQDDWRSAVGVGISGERVDCTLSFTSDGWGARAALGLTSGTDANWENFSVQWDGYIVVTRPVVLATTSDDSSRFWIDLDGDGSFATGAPELVDNNWGTGQGPTRGDLSPIILPGTYAIRIQYEEANGGNYFTIGGTDVPFELFTDAEGTTPGLTGSYVGRSLRTATAQTDWRVTQDVTGTRTDTYPAFTVNSWGSLDEVGLSTGTNGDDSDWDNFSVQWDGYLRVLVPVRMATVSDDHSRMWIDLNTNGTFGATVPEYINNGWGGGGQGMTLGQLSQVIQPGTYAIRIQYEEGGGGNGFLLGGVPYVSPDAPSQMNNTTFAGADTVTRARQIESDFTIQFWIRTTQVAGEETDWRDGMGIVDASGTEPGFGVSLGNGKVLFGIGGANEATTLRSGFIADDRWHHVSARREQATGEMTLFVDGIEAGRGSGATNLLNALTDLTIGGLSDGTGLLVGTIDQFKTWTTARSDEQIKADYHLARNTHGFTDEAPTVHLTQGENAVQVFWDPLSGYRSLEGSTTADGNYVSMGTDQNSTNIAVGANAMRFFRVRK